MANSTHTAGTWTAEHDFSGGIAIVSSHRRIHVAHVNKHAGMIDEDTANANLICAAPAMLAALRAVLSDFGDDFAGPTMTAVRVAIVTAEGGNSDQSTWPVSRCVDCGQRLGRVSDREVFLSCQACADDEGTE